MDMVIKDHAQELFLFQEMKEGKEYAFDFFQLLLSGIMCICTKNKIYTAFKIQE